MAICAGPTCTLNAIPESPSTATERTTAVATNLARRRPRVRRLAKAPPGVCSHLQLTDGFKKSLSLSGEVGLLAGDRVVSHERSRPADLSRRHRLFSRHAWSYPSDYCGCSSRRALLAYGHRCRESVTFRDVNSISCIERGSQLLPTPRRSHPAALDFDCSRAPVDHLIDYGTVDLEARTRQITGGRGSGSSATPSTGIR
jgi:hypothetical protein